MATTYEQAFAIVGSSWEALAELKLTDIKKWADVLDEVDELVQESSYRFKTIERAREGVFLRIFTPKFHPSSPHWGKRFGDELFNQLVHNCEAERFWDGYYVPEQHSQKAKNIIWRLLVENDALDLLP